MIKITNRLLFSLLITLILSSCGDDKKDTKKVFQSPSYSQKNDSQPVQAADPKYRWDDYVAFHTEGFISKTSRVSISFLSPIIDAQQIGTSAESFIQIEPSIEASVSFISEREIEIIPAQHLKSGQKYQVKVATNQLKGFPKELAQYQFNFSVIKQAFELMIDGLTASEAGDSLTIAGHITTADVVDASHIEDMLVADYLDQKVLLEWQHDAAGKLHSFSIKALPRHKQSEALVLTWDANKIQVADVGNRKIEIPAIGDFKVANIRAVQTDRQQIEVSFTDQLLASQNLAGLISLGKQKFTARVEGNLIKIYPDGIFQGQLQLVLDQAIKSKAGFKLGKIVEKSLVFLSEKPQVKFVGKGVILPNATKLTVPFEAVNVHSVQVTVFQVFANNMGQFLQSNNLTEDYENYRVGRHLWRKRVSLSSPVQDAWNRYQLDVSELLIKYPGSLFRITLSINRSNSIFSCSDAENAVPVPPEPVLTSQEEDNEDDDSYWDFADNYYNSGNVQWSQRNNPCKDGYFKYAKNTDASRNFMASNIGIIAKRGSDKSLLLTTTNLQTGKPLAAVELEIYNFQNQLLAAVKSDQKGLVETPLNSVPFYAKAIKDNQVGYLKLAKGLALPTSHFDVGGLKISKGIKGYLYGERGVWRPGDDIHLTFVLQDINDRIPAGHPVTLDFFNPKGQLISTVTNNSPVDDFYRFKLSTKDNAMTGNWKVIAKLGGAHFQKRIKIEAVIPNRLKVELSTKDNPLLGFKCLFQESFFHSGYMALKPLI
ncbi:MAG: MG2 domain-containing protein [Enterobacterales bacterium]|nr:MG2 domain-containing protein [Enterobacterales bacterium]